jgi:hypothetical protein
MRSTSETSEFGGLGQVFPFLITPLPSAKRLAGLVIGPDCLTNWETEFIDAMHAPIAREPAWCKILIQARRYRRWVAWSCTVVTRTPDVESGRRGLAVTFGAIFTLRGLMCRREFFFASFVAWIGYFQRFGERIGVLLACDKIASISQQANPEAEFGMCTEPTRCLLSVYEEFSCSDDEAPPGLIHRVAARRRYASLRSFRRLHPLSSIGGAIPFLKQVSLELDSILHPRWLSWCFPQRRGVKLPASLSRLKATPSIDAPAPVTASQPGTSTIEGSDSRCADGNSEAPLRPET